jgi:hypothetical protein
MLEMRPIDPRDFLRGDYVTLSYEISHVPSGEFNGPARLGTPLFVKLTPKSDGFYQAVSVHAAPVEVASNEVLIRGHLSGGAYCLGGPVHASAPCTLELRYGIESYFVPEGEGEKIEAARNAKKLAVVAAVTPSGRAAIRRLMIDGEPVYDEPWF